MLKNCCFTFQRFLEGLENSLFRENNCLHVILISSLLSWSPTSFKGEDFCEVN